MILCLLEIIGFSSRITLQFARPDQFSSACKRVFPEFISASDWSSGSPDLNPLDIGFGPNWRGWHATEHTLTWKASISGPSS
ncbi:unnamed protein product [Nezara viridula]|uniref:Uncharacterized protein n=1 Tax=Nezara viridula TaxID=85310 RepID=A0A9P0HLS4_NEZVI|nr:unnamed protein product [Nezara viridula]